MTEAAQPTQTRRILRLFHPYRMRLSGLLGMIVISAGIGMISPFLLRDLLDNVLSQGSNLNTRTLTLLVAGMVAIPIVTGVIGVAQTWQSNLIGQQVMHDLRASVYTHLQRLSLAFFTRTRTGEVQSRIANDIGGVQTVVTTTATSIVSNATTVLATTIAMAVLDWRLTLASFAILPLFVWMTRRVGRVRKALAATMQGSLADISTLVEESLSVSGVLLAKTMGQTGDLTQRFSRREPAPGRPRAAPAHGRPLDDGDDPGHLRDHAGADVRHRRLLDGARRHRRLASARWWRSRRCRRGCCSRSARC